MNSFLFLTDGPWENPVLETNFLRESGFPGILLLVTGCHLSWYLWVWGWDHVVPLLSRCHLGQWPSCLQHSCSWGWREGVSGKGFCTSLCHSAQCCRHRGNWDKNLPLLSCVHCHDCLWQTKDRLWPTPGHPHLKIQLSEHRPALNGHGPSKASDLACFHIVF